MLGAAEWVVVLEAGGDEAEITVEDLERLLDAVASWRPVALHAPDRYALQLVAPGRDPAQALAAAIACWEKAVGHLCLPAGPLIRSEVISPAEHERDHLLGVSPLSSAPTVERSLPRDKAPTAEEIEAEHRLLRQAFHDPLTELPSTELFVHHIERQQWEGGDGVCTVLRIALDDGDSALDPGVADSTLVALAQRLASIVRPGDVIARLSGCEFAILLEAASPETAGVVADRVRRDLASTRPGLRRETFSVSVGAASSRRGEPAEDLLARAGQAVAEAKRLAALASSPSPGIDFGAAVLSVDPHGRILSWHGAAERVFGYKADAVIGQQLSTVLPSSYEDRLGYGVSGALRGYRPRLSDLEGIRSDGRRFPLAAELIGWSEAGRPFVTIVAYDVSCPSPDRDLLMD